MPLKAADAGKTKAEQIRTDTLEEILEESSVTEFRSNLLQTIERFQQEPALRVLIRKHGKLRAVLMSAETYQALRRLASLVAAHASGLSSEERLDRALRRLEEERLESDEKTAQMIYTVQDAHDEAKALILGFEMNLRELQKKLNLSKKTEIVA